MYRYSLRQATERLQECPSPMVVSVIDRRYFDIAFIDTVYGHYMLNKPKTLTVPPYTHKKELFKALRQLQR